MVEIIAYAKKDREFLREQIKILDPHVIVCGYTFDCIDIVYDWTYKLRKNYLLALIIVAVGILTTS